MKIHYVGKGEVRACKTPGKVFTSMDISRISCLRCQESELFITDAVNQRAALEKMWSESTPRPVRNPWGGSHITCNQCGGDQFRDYGRSLFSHNHKCANCGHMNHTMTETAMCQ